MGLWLLWQLFKSAVGRWRWIVNYLGRQGDPLLGLRRLYMTCWHLRWRWRLLLLLLVVGSLLSHPLCQDPGVLVVDSSGCSGLLLLLPLLLGTRPIPGRTGQVVDPTHIPLLLLG
uniref:Putative secreted protein n=1 Tax=Panstrongylus lignarius TaxID=156445 RepID=A0A224Y1P0_9HEMI